MPGSKYNVNLNYLLLLFLLFLTKWISWPVFLSFARQEPDCTFQPRDLARSSSLLCSFHFSLDLIISQPGLLAAPIPKIILKNIYEQPGGSLDAIRPCITASQGDALFHSTSSVLLDLTHYIPLAVDKGPATGSVVPNFSKFLGALRNIFPLTFELWCTSLTWVTFELWSHFGGVRSPWVQCPKALG